MLDQIKEAVAAAWDILFAKDVGVVVRFLGFLTANPILLLPIGFYLIFLGIKTVRKLINWLLKKNQKKDASKVNMWKKVKENWGQIEPVLYWVFSLGLLGYVMFLFMK